MNIWRVQLDLNTIEWASLPDAYRSIELFRETDRGFTGGQNLAGGWWYVLPGD
jgi:hypothetical protein